MRKMNKHDQIKEMVAGWMEDADLETIFEYAEGQLTKWYYELGDELINDYHTAFIKDRENIYDQEESG